MKLKDSVSNDTIMQGGEEFSRKRQIIASLYQYSDLSVRNYFSYDLWKFDGRDTQIYIPIEHILDQI